MPSTHIQVTYKHLIEKPPLAVVRRKDATPFGYLLLSPIPQNDLLAMLMKCTTKNLLPLGFERRTSKSE